MRQQPMRVRVGDEGQLEIVDPGYDSIELLRGIDPEFAIHSEPLPGFAEPRLRVVRLAGTGLLASDLSTADDATLWNVHQMTLSRVRECCHGDATWEGEMSLLDLKIELARRMLSRCGLCAHRCGIDRTRGELGVCRLGTAATVAEHFVHIGEEAFINPSLIISLAGCGLRCRYCQQGALLDPPRVSGDALDPGLWTKLDATGARSLSFVGGNPDESLQAILKFLKAAPEDWKLPIVWNCHGYATRETIDLLDGVVDAYVPDFKYGNDECGRRLFGVANYPATAEAAVSAMLDQGVPVIVRILVLPEHFECCHGPVLHFLASVKRDNLFVSVRGQYCPDWKITTDDGALARRTIPEETESTRAQARALGLQLVD